MRGTRFCAPWNQSSRDVGAVPLCPMSLPIEIRIKNFAAEIQISLNAGYSIDAIVARQLTKYLFQLALHVESIQAPGLPEKSKPAVIDTSTTAGKIAVMTAAELGSTIQWRGTPAAPWNDMTPRTFISIRAGSRTTQWIQRCRHPRP